MTSPYPVPAATEEPLGSVTRVLGLAAGDGEDLFTGGSLPQLSGRVYGGQVVAQGMLAAAATVEDDGDGERLPHSVHAFFMRGGQPDRPISSPKWNYRITDAALTIIRRCGERDWEVTRDVYLLERPGLLELHARRRELGMVPVELPDGAIVRLSQGGQNHLIRSVVHEFCPRFTPVRLNRRPRHHQGSAPEARWSSMLRPPAKSPCGWG